MTNTAMILAAGRGERMRPLTDKMPKPLLKVHKQCLIDYHLTALAKHGISNIIVNLAYKGSMIKNHLGKGGRYGVSIQYSEEGDHALEAAGGVIKALPMLGDKAFLLINADIWTDYPYHQLSLPNDKLAALVMIDNPSHNIDGDFALDEQGLIHKQGHPMLTYSGIGLYQPELFKGLQNGKRPLKPLLLDAIQKQLIIGQHYQGQWHDIGTPARLAEITAQQLRNKNSNRK